MTSLVSHCWFVCNVFQESGTAQSLSSTLPSPALLVKVQEVFLQSAESASLQADPSTDVRANQILDDLIEIRRARNELKDHVLAWSLERALASCWLPDVLRCSLGLTLARDW